MRGGFAFIDALVAAAILTAGGLCVLTLLSQNTARTRLAQEDFWARRVMVADVSRHQLLSFGALQRRFSDPAAASKDLQTRDPLAAATGIEGSLYNSMKIERSLRFWQPSTMPEIGFLESTVRWAGADGRPHQVQLSRLLVSSRTYNSSPLQTARALAAEAPPPPPRPGEPAEAVEPDEEETGSGYVDEVTEMVHDANHRGQLGNDVHKLAKAIGSTAAGRELGAGALGGLDHDPTYRLKIIEKALSDRPIPDGVYDYQFREETLTYEHHPQAFVLYDLTGEDGKAHLLGRHESAEGWRLEGRDAFDMGYRRAGKTFARVWATRTRVYVFTPKCDADGRLVPGTQQVSIRTFAEPVDETAVPQSRDVRAPGWIGDPLRAAGAEPGPVNDPGLSVDLRRVLGA